jgi:DNA polymerase III gamma/tau subunit
MIIRHFSDLVGNNLLLSLIRKGLRLKTLPQLILLEGVLGVGKSSVAELVAMALTCEHPTDGEACLTCPTCQINLRALDAGGSGVSPQIEKVNSAVIRDDRSMSEQLRSTFNIIHTDGIYVKIFEEFHAFSQEDQLLMLEETARIPRNVQVILTTTKREAILREMASRCLVFTFSRLTQGESNVLVDRINKSMRLSPEDYRQIYRTTDGIPRNVVLLMDFLSRTGPTGDELAFILGNIGKSVFLGILANMGDFRLYLDEITGLLAKYSPEVVLRQLRYFLTQALFGFEGGIFEYLTKAELNSLPIKDGETVYRLLKMIDTADETVEGTQLLFLRLRRAFAAPQTVHEQQSAAELASTVRSSAISVASVAKLERFGRSG